MVVIYLFICLFSLLSLPNAPSHTPLSNPAFHNTMSTPASRGGLQLLVGTFGMSPQPFADSSREGGGRGLVLLASFIKTLALK